MSAAAHPRLSAHEFARALADPAQPAERRFRLRMESREAVRHVVCVDHLDAAAVGFQEAFQFMGVVIEGIVGRCDD